MAGRSRIPIEAWIAAAFLLLAAAALAAGWCIDVECPWCAGKGSFLVGSVEPDGRILSGRIPCRGCVDGRTRLLVAVLGAGR